MMGVPVFLGREHELDLLNHLWSKKAASLVALSGRRRIGKSRLAQEFGQSFDYYTFSGLPPSKAKTAADQRAYFAKRMAQQFTMPVPPQGDWTDLFWFLADRVRSGRVVLLLDELSWMAQGDTLFLGKLKTAWDEHFKLNAELILILCSSVSIWMEKNILSDKGFMRRRSLHIHLDELPLYCCNEFWGSEGERISAFEKLKFLSVTGGVPRYLEELKPNLSSEENIKLLCFDKSGILFKEFEDIFSDLFTSETARYRDIVHALASGPKQYNQICQYLNTEPNSILSGYLEELEKAGFITRDYSWHIKSGKQASLSRFRLSDNYLRFYLKHIEPNRRAIIADEFVDQSIASIINWESIIGLQFENLVLNNRKAIKHILGIQPGETLIDGPYYQNKTSKQEGCQIDYLIQTRFNTIYLCEIKFSKNKINSEVISACEMKANKLKLPKGFSFRFVLIHVNGVSNSVEDSQFFAKIIDFSELLAR